MVAYGRVLFMLTAAAVLACPVLAQSTTAQLTGRIVDQTRGDTQGASLAGDAVTTLPFGHAGRWRRSAESPAARRN